MKASMLPAFQPAAEPSSAAVMPAFMEAAGCEPPGTELTRLIETTAASVAIFPAIDVDMGLLDVGPGTPRSPTNV